VPKPDDTRPDGRLPRPGTPLSDREREVMRLAADGLTDGEIAARLFLSRHTICHHMRRSFARLGASNRPNAVALALRTGQIE
jgi:DNA-binding CsgD family transcriptional regulator